MEGLRKMLEDLFAIKLRLNAVASEEILRKVAGTAEPRRISHFGNIHSLILQKHSGVIQSIRPQITKHAHAVNIAESPAEAGMGEVNAFREVTEAERIFQIFNENISCLSDFFFIMAF